MDLQLDYHINVDVVVDVAVDVAVAVIQFNRRMLIHSKAHYLASILLFVVSM